MQRDLVRVPETWKEDNEVRAVNPIEGRHWGCINAERHEREQVKSKLQMGLQCNMALKMAQCSFGF